MRMHLQRGSDLLDTQCWQEVPGDKNTVIFPFIRKIDTNSSNSYILAMPGAVVLIDPGGLQDQMDLLAKEIESITTGNPVPVFVFLTHAHIDHFLVILSHPFFNSRNAVILAAHEKSAALLSAADTKCTQAELFGKTLKPVEVPLKFFGSGKNESTQVPAGAGGAYLSEADIFSGGRLAVRRERFCPGPGECIEIIETPGHSPDSVCYRIGTVLFVGDLLFAANPGIAGSRGWNQKDLLKSIDDVLWLLDNEDIGICCPGHGKVIPASAARAMLQAMKTDAARLGDIATVTPEWAQETARYAENLMDRVAGCFTVMAGRCYRAALILEDLEESGEAEKISGILNIRIIDEILEEFHRFNEDYRRGNQRDVHLALKAGQVSAKLEHVYRKERLDLIIDPYLVRRAARLLSDYTTTLRGLRKSANKEVFDPGSTLSLFVEEVTGPNCSDEELMALADNEEEYMLAFVRRLIRVPLFPEDPVVFEVTGQSCRAYADINRLNDLVAEILEDLAGSDYQGVLISVRPEENEVTVTIRANKTGNELEIPENDLIYIREECKIAGGSLTVSSQRHCYTISIALPRVL
jgi:glyoxylase-like metal-dependent hydrolase (beta-lactamase superfamily II)